MFTKHHGMTYIYFVLLPLAISSLFSMDYNQLLMAPQGPRVNYDKDGSNRAIIENLKRLPRELLPLLQQHYLKDCSADHTFMGCCNEGKDIVIMQDNVPVFPKYRTFWRINKWEATGAQTTGIEYSDNQPPYLNHVAYVSKSPIVALLGPTSKGMLVAKEENDYTVLTLPLLNSISEKFIQKVKNLLSAKATLLKGKKSKIKEKILSLHPFKPQSIVLKEAEWLSRLRVQNIDRKEYFRIPAILLPGKGSTVAACFAGINYDRLIVYNIQNHEARLQDCQYNTKHRRYEMVAILNERNWNPSLDNKLYQASWHTPEVFFSTLYPHYVLIRRKDINECMQTNNSSCTQHLLYNLNTHRIELKKSLPSSFTLPHDDSRLYPQTIKKELLPLTRSYMHIETLTRDKGSFLSLALVATVYGWLYNEEHPTAQDGIAFLNDLETIPGHRYEPLFAILKTLVKQKIQELTQKIVASH